jgi:MFS family permease
MATSGTPLSFGEVLRLRPVRRLWIAQIVSVIGDFLAVFAIIALVTFKLHGTATQVALVLVAFMAPFAIVSPLAGVFVDRWNVKRTMIASDLIRGVLVLALVFVHDWPGNQPCDGLSSKRLRRDVLGKCDTAKPSNCNTR